MPPAKVDARIRTYDASGHRMLIFAQGSLVEYDLELLGGLLFCTAAVWAMCRFIGKAPLRVLYRRMAWRRFLLGCGIVGVGMSVIEHWPFFAAGVLEAHHVAVRAVECAVFLFVGVVYVWGVFAAAKAGDERRRGEREGRRLTERP